METMTTLPCNASLIADCLPVRYENGRDELTRYLFDPVRNTLLDNDAPFRIKMSLRVTEGPCNLTPHRL